MTFKKNIAQVFFISSLLYVPLSSFSQQARIDSLKKEIEKQESENNKPALAKALFDFGSAILSTNGTADALHALEQSEKIYSSLGDSLRQAWCLYKIGYLYNLTGDYSKSFKLCLQSSSLSGNNPNLNLEGYNKNLLGRLYYLLSDEISAMNCYDSALTIGKRTGDEKLAAESISYMAIVWRNRDSLTKAMQMQKEALQLREKAGDLEGEAFIYLNIGILHSYMRQNDSALAWLSKSETIWKERNDFFNLAECYNYLGKAYLKLNKADIAESYFNKSLELSLKIRAKKMIRYNYYDLALINSKRGDTKKALEQILLYTDYKDSVIHDQGLLEIAHIESQKMEEKKENEIKLLNKTNELNEIRLSKNRIITWFIACGLLLVVFLAGFIFRSLSITRKQKLIIEEKNKDITDSINYAKRIQQATFPSPDNLKKLFPESFVFFLPRDIISGDFYWFAEKDGKKIIAAVDCTGHGIPGALMSMIGISFLNEIVIEKGIISPGEILSELRHLVIRSLNQTGAEGESKDGMDIALLSVDEKNSTVEFSGANNPLWIYKKETISEPIKYEADRRSVGYYLGKGLSFTSHSIQVNKGDMLYIFSDGFADQFGGSKGKKIKYKQFEKYLGHIHNENTDEQKKLLLNYFNSWKLTHEQVDDVLVMGIRI